MLRCIVIDALDRLLKRQQAIEKKLAAKHLEDGCIVLYDITSTYLEGELRAQRAGAVG